MRIKFDSEFNMEIIEAITKSLQESQIKDFCLTISNCIENGGENE